MRTHPTNDLDFLAAEAGKALLSRLAAEDLSENHTLKLITELRKAYTADEARAALTMARLRLKAVEKFGVAAASLFFTEDALQQASDPAVRAYRAGKIAQNQRVLDVCCGIGADTLAFAVRAGDVHGVEMDPVRAAMARHNAAVMGFRHVTIHTADVTLGLPDLPTPDLIFYDPARRDSLGNRIYDVERYMPPLSLVRGWHADRTMVKLSPGVDLTQLADYGGQVEFISVDGDLKEAVLHLGGGNPGMLATLLTQDAVHHWWRVSEPDVTTAAPRAWLVEPDPAIIRAGLVEDVAQHFNGTLLDETIAYFCTDDKPESAWVRGWQVRGWMPFNLKKLRAYLRERNIGTVTVKKRGSPLTPESLIPKLKLKGEQSCTLVLTRFEGQPIVLVCDDYAV